MWHRVRLVRTNVSGKHVATIFRVEGVELGTTLIAEWCLLGCYAVWLL
jgi:hypothetical protein